MQHSPIGLIGSGLLGSALAERMLAAGMPVVGYDRDPAAQDRLVQLGGERAAASAEVACRCRCLVVCLPDSRVVAGVIAELGENLSPGALVIDATTGDPEETGTLAERLAGRGIGYVDATIAGSSDQARRGAAVIILGGREGDALRARPVLNTWSSQQFHVGPPGSGAKMKLIVNLALGLNRAVLAESLALAQACGFDLTAALEVMKATPAYSAAMDTKGPKMVSGDFTPVARLAQHWKDVRLIRELAQRHAAITPLSDVHEELLKRAVELGLGDADNSAIIRAFLPAPPS